MGTDAGLETMVDEQEYLRYRSLCVPALVALVLGLISPLLAFVPMLLVFPALGLLAGGYGLWKIRQRPAELTGRRMAQLGLLLNGVVLLGGAAAHSYVYATEVPPGYQRISFLELQPEADGSRLPVPRAALELDGQRVFIKGYVFPDGQRTRIKKFVLVPDMGTCCFGGQPKLTDMIEVTLRPPLHLDYSFSRRKLGGTLRVDTRLKPVSGVNGVYYQLDADFLR